MALILPSTPAPRDMAWSKISAANTLTPAFGGADQEINRKGTRYALTFDMPPMTYVQNMEWDDLLEEGQTVVMRVYQPGLDIGAPGTPLANGVGFGRSLPLKGLTPGYLIRKGQWLTQITGGQRFLHRASLPVVANGAGVATVTPRFMLRRPTAADDVIEIAEPKIEGLVRDIQEMSVGVERLVAVRFTVRERE